VTGPGACGAGYGSRYAARIPGPNDANDPNDPNEPAAGE
jgi:hypothetical protein